MSGVGIADDRCNACFLVSSRWIDTPPHFDRSGRTWTGFVDAYGALFEDFRTKSIGTAVPIFLLQRLLVGVVAGTTIPLEAQPDPAAATRQILLLASIFFAFFLWLAIERPFLVPAANFFEATVALCSMAVSLLNLWLVADDGESVLGIKMAKEDASTHMTRLMFVALVGMGYVYS